MSLRVLVTRGEREGRRTAARLEALGFEAVLLPLSETVALPAALPEGWEMAGRVAVTSANALRHAPRTVLAALYNVPLHAVGARTAEAAREAGFVRVSEGPGDAAGLATQLGQGGSRSPLLFLCGRLRRPDFERDLLGAGVGVLPVETYDTCPLQTRPKDVEAALGDRPVEAVLLFSVLAAEGFAAIRTHPLIRAAAVFALSPRIAAAAGPAFASALPNEDALLALLAGWARGAEPREGSFPLGQTW